MKFDMGEFAKSLGTVSESDHSEELIYLPLADLVSDENNFYALSEIPDLAANIELCGLQQPLRVRKDGDAYRIVSGHRRRAALELLLKDGAKRALEIKANFVPTFPSVQAFFAFIDQLDMDKEAVIYNEDGTVTLDYQK